MLCSNHLALVPADDNLVKMNVHRLAAAGFQQGANYNDNRPSYTDEAADYITRIVDASSDLPDAGVVYDVLELGAGTGLFTRKILTHLPKTIRYLATEPSEGFLKTLQEKSPDVQTKQCTADSVPLPDNSVKNVICAQCFHWFAQRHVLDEIRRVLVDQGKLILINNTHDWTVAWMNEVIEHLYQIDSECPIHCLGGSFPWKEVFQGYSGFQDEHYTILPGVDFRGDENRILRHFFSISVVGSLNDRQKSKVEEFIKNVLQRHPETRNKREIDLLFKTTIFVYKSSKR